MGNRNYLPQYFPVVFVCENCFPALFYHFCIHSWERLCSNYLIWVSTFVQWYFVLYCKTANESSMSQRILKFWSLLNFNNNLKSTLWNSTTQTYFLYSSIFIEDFVNWTHTVPNFVRKETIFFNSLQTYI